MFAIVERNNLKFVTAGQFRQPWLCQVFTTRPGGVSPAPFDSLNMGLHTEDEPANVLANRERVAAALGFSLQTWVCAEQVHGVGWYHVTEEDAGRGALTYDSSLPATDILVTDTPGILLVSLYADCVPVILVDPRLRAVAVAHCGWQGTLAGAACVAVQVMGRVFGSIPGDLLATVGPGIGPCCYEVSSEIAHAFREKFGPDVAFGRQLDLRLVNRRVLGEAGLAADATHVAPWCTKCQQELFFSHRGSGGKTGRIATLIGVRQVRV